MCILFIYTIPKPKKEAYRLILASNRDEYYHRIAKNAFLSNDYNIIGGRDAEKGREEGMWIGISLAKTKDYNCRIGALLNVTGEEKKENVIGRGPIVLNYLKDQITSEDYLRCLNNTKIKYNAYNFVAVELRDEDTLVMHYSNTDFNCVRYSGEQFLGFGNSSTSVPLLKVTNGTKEFEEIIKLNNNINQKDELVDGLTRLLKSNKKNLPDPELKRRAPFGFDFLSSIYVKSVPPGYGTRTHTLMLVDSQWNVEFIEMTMKEPIDIENPIWETTNLKASL